MLRIDASCHDVFDMPEMFMPSPASRSAAFREMKRDEPDVVRSTRRKFGPERARRQEIAIGLNKARKMDRTQRRDARRS